MLDSPKPHHILRSNPKIQKFTLRETVKSLKTDFPQRHSNKNKEFEQIQNLYCNQKQNQLNWNYSAHLTLFKTLKMTDRRHLLAVGFMQTQIEPSEGYRRR